MANHGAWHCGKRKITHGSAIHLSIIMFILPEPGLGSSTTGNSCAFLAISIGNFAKQKKLAENAVEIFLRVVIVGCGQLGHKFFERADAL